MAAERRGIDTIDFGGAQIHLTQVRFGPEILLDELHIEGGDVSMQMPSGAPGALFRMQTGECMVRAVMSEPNVNRLVTAGVPEDAPVRGLQIAFLSGKARITGTFVKVIGLPFSVDVTPRINNGNRVMWDFTSARIGVGLPHVLVEVLERLLNERLTVDLSGVPVPVWVDEARCEPGRLTLLGKTRITLPFADKSPCLVAAQPAAALPPAL